MSREVLITNIMDSFGTSRKEAEGIIKKFIVGVEKSLIEGESVSLLGFGKFTVQDVPERTGRNPSTGETITIEARKRPKFVPGKKLKLLVNATQ